MTYNVPFTDYKAALKPGVENRWRDEWNGQVKNKLQVRKPLLRKWEGATYRERFYEVLYRLRIRHTRLAHNILL